MPMTAICCFVTFGMISLSRLTVWWVLHRTYSVLAVDPNSCQVQLDSDLDTRGTSEWRLDGQPVSVSCPDQCVASITPPHSVSVDAVLEQVQFLPSVDDICQEFVSLWGPRWQKQNDLSPDHWHRVLNFAAAHLPSGHFDLPPLSLQSWRTALKHFRPRAARGPDGFALADLRHMPDSLALELLDFLSSILKLGFKFGLISGSWALFAGSRSPITCMGLRDTDRLSFSPLFIDVGVGCGPGSSSVTSRMSCQTPLWVSCPAERPLTSGGSLKLWLNFPVRAGRSFVGFLPT